MLRLVLRGRRTKYWYVWGDVRGVRVRKTTGLREDQRDAADLIRLQMEMDLVKTAAAPHALDWQERGAAGKIMRTVAAACDDFLRRPDGVSYNDRLTVELIRRAIGGVRVATITAQDVADFARTLSGSGSTVRRRLVVLRSLLNRERRMGHLVAVPHFEMPPENDARDRALTEAERDALIAAADDWFRPLLAFLLYTGARLGEAVRVVPGDFGPVGVVLSSRKGKGGKLRKRVVPVHPKLRALLVAPGFVEAAGVPVFRTKSGAPWSVSDGRSAVRSGWTPKVHEPFRQACARAGIVDFLPHDCRHTFATLLAEKGADIDDIATLLGHSSTVMTARYKTKRPSRLSALVEAI